MFQWLALVSHPLVDPFPQPCSSVHCRNTFHCYVIGPHGSGKSALVRALAPGPDSGKQGPCVAAGAVQTDGRDKVLVMSEVRPDTEAGEGGGADGWQGQGAGHERGKA